MPEYKTILDLIEIHSRENNSESQAHLNQNRDQFTDGCRKVLKLLQEGNRLTTINAVEHKILSLPRRIKDLKDYNGIQVRSEWLRGENGKRIVKEYFL